MLKLQLIGLPLRDHRRLSVEMNQWRESKDAEIQSRPVPSFKEHAPEITNAEIKKIKENASDGFVHLLLIPMRGEFFRRILNEFVFDCRVVRLNLDDTNLRSLEWGTLQQSIEGAIAYEERWRSTVSPKDVNSCLLLPPPCFEPNPDLVNFWSKCDVYWDTTRLGQAHDLLGRVAAQHRKSLVGQGVFWLDNQRRKYTHDKSSHGFAKEEREGYNRYRFCYPVPAGFHFDVVTELGGKFQVCDCDKRFHSIYRANIDPWGKVMPRT